MGDLDECKISAQEESHFCLEALPRCDISAGAICKNTPGSYTCECPKCTEGDGFLPISGLKLNDPSSPVNYSGGTGCTDNCKPTITLKGPNPKVFRACKCGGLLGMTKHARGIERNEGEAGNFDADVKALIKASSGAELCATKENKDVVEPGMCAAAVDHTPDGVVDLTAQIQVGDPVKHPTKKNSWRVPYNVVDKAGNRAQTVWRDVRVDELTFDEVRAAPKLRGAKRSDEVAVLLSNPILTLAAARGRHEGGVRGREEEGRGRSRCGGLQEGEAGLRGPEEGAEGRTRERGGRWPAEQEREEGERRQLLPQVRDLPATSDLRRGRRKVDHQALQ